MTTLADSTRVLPGYQLPESGWVERGDSGHNISHRCGHCDMAARKRNLRTEAMEEPGLP